MRGWRSDSGAGPPRHRKRGARGNDGARDRSRTEEARRRTGGAVRDDAIGEEERVDSPTAMSQPIGVYGGGELVALLRERCPEYTFVDDGERERCRIVIVDIGGHALDDPPRKSVVR